MDRIGKTTQIAKRVFNIATIIFGICVVVLLGVVIVSLIALTPEAHLKHWVSIMSAIGALLAGLGTVALAYLAYRAIGDWENQTALKYEHSCVMAFRKEGLELRKSMFLMFHFLVGNVHK